MSGQVHVVVTLATVATVMLAVSLHYEAFIRLSRWLERSNRRGRQRILLMILSLILVHVIEIWLFAFSAWSLIHGMEGAGEVMAPYSLGFLDYVYLSATTFTTLGYGDVFPSGPIRFLFGTEALTGFALITWSASLTFLEMQRYWRTDD